MARKLIKYGKFLMSMALIFCLMAPTYASLSASDGSAFVTKSEVDSAFGDFNARLTTFEAGINSKIDSKVTSYLDRNGIWSGATQEINKGHLSKSFTAFAANNTTTGRAWGKSQGIVEDVYIQKTTKPGMLIGSWKWYGTAGVNDNHTRWGWHATCDPATAGRNDNGFQLVTYIDVYNGTTFVEEPYSYMFGCAAGQLCAPGGGSESNMDLFMPISTVNIITPFKFFVAKNMTLKWGVVCHCHFGYLNGNPSPQTNSQNQITVEYLDALIY